MSKPLDGCRIESKRVDRIIVTGPAEKRWDVTEHLASLGFGTTGLALTNGPDGGRFVLRMERENPDSPESFWEGGSS